MPRSIEAERGDHDLNDGMLPFLPLKPAAVLMPLIDRPNEITVLFTQRTSHLAHHAGQVSFPGGQIEAGDGGPAATALRETEEEIGLERRFVRLIGHLDTYVTRTGFIVTPVVGVVSPPFRFVPDPFEVAEVFEVPLSFHPRSAQPRALHGEFRGNRATLLRDPLRAPLHLGRHRRHADQLLRHRRQASMNRVLLQYVLPLLLPTVVYLLWWGTHRPPPGDGGRRCRHPGARPLVLADPLRRDPSRRKPRLHGPRYRSGHGRDRERAVCGAGVEGRPRRSGTLRAEDAMSEARGPADRARGYEGVRR